MKRLIRSLFLMGIAISIGVILAFYFTRGNFLNSLLNGFGFCHIDFTRRIPCSIDYFLSIGAWRLSKNNVLTRKPTAIETLGSATVFCSDKTGTITQNKMEVTALYSGEKLYYKKDFKHSFRKYQEVLMVLVHASQHNSIDPMERAIWQWNEQLHIRRR